jgi:hypothetical protein
VPFPKNPKTLIGKHKMEIAKALVVLTKHHEHPTRDMTPAEALIIQKIHFSGSDGTPLKNIEVIGEAVEVDEKGKSAVEAYVDPINGRVMPAVDAVPEKNHKRTNAEEIARLKRKYTGNVTVEGRAVNAFTATFGNASRIQLPQTFKEIEEDLDGGHTGLIRYPAPVKPQESDEESTPRPGASPEVETLMLKTRKELLVEGEALGLVFTAADNKETIATAIVGAKKAI